MSIILAQEGVCVDDSEVVTAIVVVLNSLLFYFFIK